MMNKQPGAIPPHLIERAWEIYTHHMTGSGGPPPDKLFWLGGVASALGVVLGTLPVGIPEGAYMGDVLAQLVNDELPKYHAELTHLEEEMRKRVN